MAALKDGSPLEPDLTLLLTDRARCSQPVVLTLYDFRLIESPPVTVRFQMEH